jgi:ascorbate-specific PTS system EIIC-type component UlaA
MQAMTSVLAASTGGWWAGLILGFLAVAVIVVVVAVVLALASRIADKAHAATLALPVVRDQTDVLHDVAHVNASAITILRVARAARKALTGS